jgi:hypothetical protein
MDNRDLDQQIALGLPRTPTRRILLGAAAGLLCAGGLLADDAMARRVRNRRRNRNHNRRNETSISIPGQPGQPGEDGEP